MTAVDRAIDDLLRGRGFTRGWYGGGPPHEAPFWATDRGLRYYTHADAGIYVIVTKRGTWHGGCDGEKPYVRGVGVPHLVTELRRLNLKGKVSA